MWCGVFTMHVAIQGITPAVNCISEYAVRVSSRVVAQVQERVSTGWEGQHYCPTSCPTQFGHTPVL